MLGVFDAHRGIVPLAPLRYAPDWVDGTSALDITW